MSRTWSSVLALLAVGCSGDTGDTAAAACDTAPPVSWDGWADGFFRTYCTSCHSEGAEDRWGAPEGVDFDTAADVERWESLVRTVVLEQATMPPAGGVYEDDLVLLEVYLRCGGQ